MRIEERVRKAYNVMARTYHNERTSQKTGSYFYNECIEMPTTLSLFGSIKGKRILDVGCGTGIYARELLKRGAIVHGIDQSEAMLDIAREYAPRASFKQGTAYPLPYPSKHFDMVLSALVIDHIDDLTQLFKEIHRVLKPNGFFIFSGRNPLTECRDAKRFGKHRYGLLGYRRDGKEIFGDYFKEGWTTTDWDGTPIYHCHRTYETILNTLLKSGFKLTAYKDAKPKGRSNSKIWKTKKKIFSKFPIFYSIKAQKE